MNKGADMADIIELHERITVTFTAETSRLIRAEMERQRRQSTYEPQTPEEFVEKEIRFHCEAMAPEIDPITMMPKF
jgi:hypothetical protein